MRLSLLAVCAALTLIAPAAAQETTAPPASPVAAAPTEAAPEAAAPDAEAAAPAAQEFYESLTRRTGAITLVDGKVEINVPETHYYLGPEDARRIIVDLWGNPPMSAQGVEGMIFPAETNPALGGWGAVLEYLADGHVDDSDAATINYDDLLRELQQQMTRENEQRRASGYVELSLTGWAEPPHYDQATHTLYWAKNLEASDGSASLNYDIRVLGREGVFVVSFVAAPEEIDLIRASAPAVMAMPQFTTGNRYADFQEGVDQRAAYGLGGLIAGGALAAVAQKTGLLAMILAFGKKFIVLIIAGVVGLFGVVRRMFGGGGAQS
jgi:uncharacterized membrane-anchored protein